MRWRSLGFEARLGITSTLVIAIVCAGLSWQLASGAVAGLRAHLGQRAQTLVATLADDASEALQRGDLDALAAAAEHAHAQGDVVAIRIFDSHGLLLVAAGARTDAAAASPPLHELPIDAIELPGVGLDVVQPIVSPAAHGRADRIGVVDLVISLGPVEALRRRILVSATVLTMLFMAIGAVAAWGLARALTRPLAELAAATTAVAQGDFSARVTVRRADELGTVGAAFNAMATNLAHSHRALEAKVSELERANHLKSEFVATVSHELRTPLNVIIGHAEMLAEALPERSDYAPLVATIRRYAELQLDLVTSVLDFERLASGELTCGSERFALGPLVADVLALQAAHIRPGVRLVSAVSPACPELESDRTKVHQIVRNLVDNAVKFTESGRVLVEVGPGADDQHVVIAVTDTGPGVPAEELPHIFEPFHQIGPTSTRRTGGVGLGLSIVQRLSAMLGGTVSVSSELGCGSTFRIELPCRVPDATQRGARVALRPVRGRGRRAA